MQVEQIGAGQPAHFRMLGMTHFSQQDNFSVAARVLGALFYYAQRVQKPHLWLRYLTRDGRETQWPLPEASLSAAGDGFSDTE